MKTGIFGLVFLMVFGAVPSAFGKTVEDSHRILVHNRSGYDGTFSIWGDDCWVLYEGKSLNPFDLSRDLTSAEIKFELFDALEVPCQQIEIRNGESFAFSLGKDRIRESKNLHVKAFFKSVFGFSWACINSENGNSIGFNSFRTSEFLSPNHSYEISFAEEYSSLWTSYYCDIETVL